jgi:predicted Zn-dependent protease
MNSTLQDKAIKFALNKEWEEAAEVNKRILKASPTDNKARLRLAKALIHLEDFTHAEKLLKEVLKEDPINRIAKKNLAIIKEKTPALSS